MPPFSREGGSGPGLQAGLSSRIRAPQKIWRGPGKWKLIEYPRKCPKIEKNEKNVFGEPRWIRIWVKKCYGEIQFMD